MNRFGSYGAVIFGFWLITSTLAQAQKAPIQITVDLSEAPRRLYHAEIDLPVTAGPLTLTSPKWIPGDHMPSGPANSITGVVFTAIIELAAIAAVCRDHNLRLHMDGARFANACAGLGFSPAELTWKNGIDVLCFGGTKNGMAVGEAILFFDWKLAEDFDYRCKQAGQLSSKMRFLAAPWVGMLQSGAWLRNAAHANACARYLADHISGIPGIKIVSPVEANAVFVKTSDEILDALRQRNWKFYTFIGGAARFMCSWDTSRERIDEFCSDVRRCAVNTLA